MTPPTSLIHRALVAQCSTSIAHSALTCTPVTFNYDPPISPDQWIQNIPRGAYTAARTVNQNYMFDFTAHVARTASSFNQIRQMEATANHSLLDLQTKLADPSKLNTVLRPLVKRALSSFYAIPEIEPQSPVKVTWVVSLTGTLAVHCTPLSSPGPQDWTCTRALVAGQPRRNASAKDTQWVLERSKLTNMMSNSGNTLNEILLVHDRLVYEGLSSNFFCIVTSAGRLQIQTAPLTDVLTGTVLNLVVQAAKDLDVQLSFMHPHLDDVWTGAFISSTSRLLLPLAMIHISESGAVLQFNDPPTVALLTRLHNRVSELMLQGSELILD